MERNNRRKTKLVKINDSEALERLLQEVYTNACQQISDATVAINTLKIAHAPQDVDDASKIAKEVGNLLKVRDLAIKVKLDISKILGSIIEATKKGESVTVTEEMADVINNKSDKDETLSDNDMERIRQMVSGNGK